jgi:hypothetical protein
MSTQAPMKRSTNAAAESQAAPSTQVPHTRSGANRGTRMLLGSTGLATLIGIAGSGCLSREVVSREPTTKSSFVSAVPNKAIDKIDVLLAIDNSSSMGDKQKFLAAAVPKLVSRLVTPNCVDDDGKVLGASNLQAGKAVCANGKAEFEAINDIHIGVVTSSLGGLGGNECATDPKRTFNDRGQLIKRDGAGTPIAQIEPGNFLAWYPPATRNADAVAPTRAYLKQEDLSKGTQDLVKGAGETGCGFEAQLESVYHFLIAPDPWEAIKVEGAKATYDGLDKELLKQRADFLRPDSLVAVIMLTDEDDSSADPLAVQGAGWSFTSDGLTRPGTSACAANYNPTGANVGVGPNDPKCQTCLAKASASDPSCVAGFPTPDRGNTRYFHMKQRYGIDPQYPVSRYVRGLSQKRVPARAAEHDGNGTYVGDAKSECTNPLFAKKVYDGSEPFDATVADKGCNVAVGDRDPSLVFFAIIGGVPNELLVTAPGEEKGKLTGKQWEAILGRDPATFDYTGIDPRMIQSITPRDGRPGPGSPDALANDPLNKSHRDWKTETAGVGQGALNDLQFACTFPLPGGPDGFQRPGTPNSDCSPSSDAPLCTGTGGARTQVRAKAYPTVRQFMVARALGDQGIAASLCPQETENTNSELYGYTPAVSTIVDRLKNALTGQCLPRKFNVKADGTIDCLMLEVLPEGATTCDPAKNKKKPEAAIEAKFREGLIAAKDTERAKRTICEVTPVVTAPGSDCGPGDKPGWCYVQNTDAAKPAGRCGQKVQFQKDTLVNGSTVFLQCIDQSNTDGGAP